MLLHFYVTLQLLELHLRDFPPASKAERQLMQREVKLAEAADLSRSDRERREAIREANDILERLIDSSRDDPRRFEWRLTLAQSLLYDESEPHLTNLLYRVAGPDARAVLQETTRRGRIVRSGFGEVRFGGDARHGHLEFHLGLNPVSVFLAGHVDAHVSRFGAAQVESVPLLTEQSLQRFEGDPTRFRGRLRGCR